MVFLIIYTFRFTWMRDVGEWGVGGGRRSGMLPFGRHGNPSFLSPYKMFAEKN